MAAEVLDFTELHRMAALSVLLSELAQSSVAELARLMARTKGGVDAHVLFLSPPGVQQDWVQSDLWRDAAAIPGVHVARDDRGAEAERFGALTSGQTMLYDRRGRLQFSGGICRSHSRRPR